MTGTCPYCKRRILIERDRPCPVCKVPLTLDAVTRAIASPYQRYPRRRR